MPKRIGKYEITAEIGRGGFSRVYRGFDPNVNRPVAIKVSTRESDPEHLSRFRNEASAAGNLRHENIVTIHDYGDDDGVPYLVMELLDGRDLHHIMRDGPKLSLLDKMQVMSQVAAGLHCAHLNGVVHRDIKPANVMLLTDGTVKILDFGIARMTGEVSRLTQSGYLVGTPLYMSPEQLQGSDADASSDVWAYGVLYFELLTGQHPFLSQDNTRLIRNITIVNPPSVHSLTRGVPEGLAQVIRRALTKDRRRRYQSLEDVLVDTNPILALLQREQTAGLVTEAQYYRNSGQLTAARQTSRRALEIDPSNYGAQQLLKSIQHEMQVENFSVPVERPLPPAAVPPPPPAPVMVRLAPVRINPPQDEPEMILPDEEPPVKAPPAAPPAPPTPAPVATPRPSFNPRPTTPPPQPVAAPMPAPPAPVTPPPAPVQAPMPAYAASLSSAVAPSMSVGSAIAVETPETTNQRPRTATMASGAAAAIAAAVAAAKARQAEEEKQQKEQEADDEPEVAVPAIKATPLVVSALPNTRVAPVAPPTGSFKRPENGTGVFTTADPLVVKRPASAVMTQRMKASETAAEAAVSAPAVAPPPPPTRLPGTKAIPSIAPRPANGTAEVNGSAAESRSSIDNLPMRRPPSEVYSQGKRRKSGSQEKQKESGFPIAVVLLVLAVLVTGGALAWFSWSAPKYVSSPSLLPEKMAFAWKADAPLPGAQLLSLKGGAQNASFTAVSDSDWLIVTPELDEANNRNWQVKVEPDKLGTTLPNTYTGWIEVSSGEGFKTQAEVTLKIGAAESSPAGPATPAVKGKKAAQVPKAEVPANLSSTAPATKQAPTVTEKPAVKSVSDSAKTVTTKALPPVVKAPAPAVKTPAAVAPAKKPAADGIDINDLQN